MALRGWRLFGVAGTIFAYVAGILLLSIISMNSPNQRRARPGQFGDFDQYRRDMSPLAKREPLKWCSELKFLDSNGRNESKIYIDSKQNHFSNDKTAIKLLNAMKYRPKKFFPAKNKPIGQAQFLKSYPPKTNSTVDAKNSIALASFPGSGNTWIRYLLQQATGKFTGSVYKDFGLVKSGFPAENISNSSVLVVKTHEWGPNAWKHFRKAILLVRDPDSAILAEFNRQSGGHVGFASPERYKRTRGRYWTQFVTNKLWAWEQMNLQWFKNFTRELKIVYYDDLINNVEWTLRDILKFIEYPINEELLSCTLSRKEGIYRRKKRIMSFDPYSPAMHKAIDEKKREVYAQLGRNKLET